LKAEGWRLIQILAVSSAEANELSYSFGLGMQFKVLRFKVASDQTVPSITPVYLAAYLYENEIRDLFGVKIERIAVDWLGKVYDVKGDKPFSRVTVAGSCVECPPSSITAHQGTKS
ncbi:MAG TPA: NADH-quinone oxidoreductase subunit C, partial [Rectinemataceae bacterium]|nr:NADH-quinone oxidoreductase subunit C [Rectinemataceae bacterium]